MTVTRQIDSAQISAALDWWREAGVDHVFANTPTYWLADLETASSEAPPAHPERHKPSSAKLSSAAPSPVRIGGDAAAWPTDLAAFQRWWLTEPSLDNGHVHGRIPPRGPAGAVLMVLVEQPEQGDDNQLLSGAEGRLLNGFLRAAGIAAEAVYLCSVLPRHTPLPDWVALDTAGLGELTRHHIVLAAPRRVLALGAHASSLLGTEPPKNGISSPEIYQETAKPAILAAPSLATMNARPRSKVRLWSAWLDWMEHA